METRRYKATVIGVGNLLMGDDGFGVHVIRFLEENFVFPQEVRIIDCGTAGIYMAPAFEATERAIVVDAAAMKGYAPGTVVRLSHEEVNVRQIQSSLSPHQIGVLEVLEICRFRGNMPESVDFFLVVPQRVEPGLELSGILVPRVREVARIVVDELRKEAIAVKNA